MNRTVLNQKGFTLIEALVAFLIVAIGMLGIASLQVISLRTTSTASYHTAALLKGQEMADRMRANPTALASYSNGTGDAGTDNGCNDFAGSVKSCTPDELALDDIFHWKNEIKTVLPNDVSTTASVIVDAVPPGQVLTPITIEIKWSERSVDADENASENNNVIFSFDMCGAATC